MEKAIDTGRATRSTSHGFILAAGTPHFVIRVPLIAHVLASTSLALAIFDGPEMPDRFLGTLGAMILVGAGLVARRPLSAAPRSAN